MGSDVHIVVHGPPALTILARDLVLALERRWSRFLPNSEVSLLNARAGRWTHVGEATLELVARAIEGWQVTNGRYDPTVLGDVIRAGYDRSFEQIALLSPRAERPRSGLVNGAGGLAVDRDQGAVLVPAGVGFDPGGIGKGLAADLVAARISAEGAAGVLVNIGGDLRVVGVAAGGETWSVDLDPAAAGQPIGAVALDDGAVATSTVLRRRWLVGGENCHHLIDPATGRPVSGRAVSASVLAARGWQAEVLAKAALVAGIEDGVELIAGAGAEGVMVDDTGDLHPTAGFGRFLRAEDAVGSASAQPAGGPS